MAEETPTPAPEAAEPAENLAGEANEAPAREAPGDDASNAQAASALGTRWAAEAPDDDELPPHLEAEYRRLTRRMIVSVTLLVVVVFAASAFIGTRAISRRFDGARKLDRAQQLVKEADAVVLDVDEVVRGQLGPGLAEKATAANAKVPGAQRSLEEAIRLIDSAYGSVTEDEQRGSRLLRAAAAARVEMLKPAGPILVANAQAGRAIEPAKQGWVLVLQAEKLADQAVVEYNRLTKDGVTKASQLSTQAVNALGNARVYMSQAATSFPEAGFSRYLDFIDGKIALLQLSMKSNAAWLAGKPAEANSFIKQYNAKEPSVIAIAKTLPETPSKAVVDAYDREVGQYSKAYFEARAAATKADAALDSY